MTGIDNISILSNLPKLKSLSISDCEKTDLSTLGLLSGLAHLNLGNNKIKDISCLKNLCELKTLDLSDNNLIKDFSALSRLHLLQNVDLSATKVSDLSIFCKPANIQKLKLNFSFVDNFSNLKNFTKLKSLAIWGDEINDLQFLEELTNLQKLLIGHNNIFHLEPLRNLVNLKFLNASNNIINDISPIEGLKSLKSLRLSGNPITDISVIESIPGIENLSISTEELDDFSPLRKLKELKDLRLDGVASKDLSFIKEYEKLEILRIFNSPFIDFRFIKELTKLKELYLINNQIEEIAFLKNLTNLNSLNLTRNKISDINFLRNLENLTHLSLGDNKIQELSPLEDLEKLELLMLQKNLINNISPIKNNQSLLWLDLSENKLEDLPILEDLKNYGYIRLSRNNIKVFPKFLLDRPWLQVLSLTDNPIEDLPYEIVNEDNCLEDARNWLKDLKDGSVVNTEAKLIIIGNGRIGKSCILDRLAGNKFEPQKSSTHAIQIEKWEKKLIGRNNEEVPVSVNIWDFGGQDIYHSTHRYFMQSRALILIVWDWETEMQKFTPAKEAGADGFEYRNYKLPHWLDFVRSLSKKSPVIIVQNKVDRDGAKRVANRQLLDSMYEISEYCRVSAQTGRGMVDLEETILETLKSMPEIGMHMPSSWHEILSELKTLKETEKEIPYTLYEEISNRVGLHTTSQSSLLKYLHNLGILFYDEDLFENRIILDQQWAIEAIYSLFDREKMFFDIMKNGKGQFSYDMLEKFWKMDKGFDEDTCKVALSFMESCEICFNLNERHSSTYRNPTFISPQLLPKSKPSGVSLFWAHDKADELYVRYKYAFVHEAFIHRFIFRANHLAQSHHIWSNGIWLQWNSTHGLIEKITEDKLLFIQFRIFGPKKKELLQRIKDEFEEIHPFKIDFDIWVSVNGRDFCDIKEVEEYYRKGKTEMLAKNSEEVNPQDFTAFFWLRYRDWIRREGDNGIKRLGNHEVSMQKQIALNNSIKSQIKDLISKRNFKLALEELTRLSDESQLVIIQARLNRISERRVKKITSDEELDLEENKIIDSLLQIVDNLEYQG